MKKTIKVITAICISMVLSRAKAEAYYYVFQLAVSANYVIHRDSNFRDVYGNDNFSIDSKAALRVFKGLHITGGIGFLKTKGVVPGLGTETEAFQNYISAGLDYNFELSYSWEFKIGAEVLKVNYEESAFGENISDSAFAYRLEGGLVYILSRVLFIEILSGYTYGSDDVGDVSVKLGGFHAGISFGARL